MTAVENEKTTDTRTIIATGNVALHPGIALNRRHVDAKPTSNAYNSYGAEFLGKLEKVLSSPDKNVDLSKGQLVDTPQDFFVDCAVSVRLSGYAPESAPIRALIKNPETGAEREKALDLVNRTISSRIEGFAKAYGVLLRAEFDYEGHTLEDDEDLNH